MNGHKLKVIKWEDTHEAICVTAGWEIGRDKNMLYLAAQLEQVTNAEYVPTGITEIPIDAIHSEEIVKHRKTA